MLWVFPYRDHIGKTMALMLQDRRVTYQEVSGIISSKMVEETSPYHDWLIGRGSLFCYWNWCLNILLQHTFLIIPCYEFFLTVPTPGYYFVYLLEFPTCTIFGWRIFLVKIGKVSYHYVVRTVTLRKFVVREQLLWFGAVYFLFHATILVGYEGKVIAIQELLVLSVGIVRRVTLWGMIDEEYCRQNYQTPLQSKTCIGMV